MSSGWLELAFRIEELELNPFPRERDRNRYRALLPHSTIVTKLTRLRAVRICGAALLTPSIMTAMGNLKYLNSVEFTNVGERLSNATVIQCLKSLEGLRHFGLTHCQYITSEILPELLKKSELTSLVLWDNVRDQVAHKMDT